MWRIHYGGVFFLGMIFFWELFFFWASICAFAFAFAAFASFARAFVTSALLSAHLLLSCFRVVFCLSFCRTSKCNACVCPACSRSSQPTYALRLVWMHSGSQVGSLRAHVQLHAGMWGYQPVSNTTTETKRQTAHPCEATSPTSPPKSRSASRWTSHTASPSISPNYARSSQANTGTARAAQSSARSRMWSVCSYHDRSGCDPSNAGDPWAPGLYCDCQNAAQWSVRFVALGYRSSSITLGKKKQHDFHSLRSPAVKDRGVPHHGPARQCWICCMLKNFQSEAKTVMKRLVCYFRGMWVRVYSNALHQDELKRQCPRLCLSIACFFCTIHSIELHVLTSGLLTHALLSDLLKTQKLFSPRRRNLRRPAKNRLLVSRFVKEAPSFQVPVMSSKPWWSLQKILRTEAGNHGRRQEHSKLLLSI